MPKYEPGDVVLVPFTIYRTEILQGGGVLHYPYPEGPGITEEDILCKIGPEWTLER